MLLLEGNFREFSAEWKFEALSPQACKVSLSMTFEFSRSFLDLAASTLFSSMANAQVDAIVKRAAAVYGN
jgi:ribosome-associated toxin RatA of RatAB toxin-antitoxin module